MVADYPAARALGLRFWLVVLATLLGAGATAWLGFWQLARAAQKQEMQAAIDARARLPVLRELTVRAGGAPAPGAELLYRRVALQGRWLDRATVFLDNRQMGGRQGFEVLTPLQLVPSGLTVVVQRGWVPRNFDDRTALPALPAPQGMVQVEGRIAPAPGSLYELGTAPPGRIRQNLDLARFAQELGLPLAPYTVQQSGPSGDGLLRDWPAIDAGVAKHQGYAVQWFALCGLIIGLFVWFQCVRRFLLPR